MKKPAIWPLFLCGFTLLELISSLSIACILLAVGIPSIQTLNQNSRMTSAVNTITAHLNLARSEAIKRGVRVVLCPSEESMDCNNTMIWDNKIIMFTDINKSGHLDPGEELLKQIMLKPGFITISTTTGRRKAAYDANGFSMGMNVTFTFCDTNNQIDPKAVIVSNTGRPRLSHTMSNGDPLSCNEN